MSSPAEAPRDPGHALPRTHHPHPLRSQTRPLPHLRATGPAQTPPPPPPAHPGLAAPRLAGRHLRRVSGPLRLLPLRICCSYAFAVSDSFGNPGERVSNALPTGVSTPGRESDFVAVAHATMGQGAASQWHPGTATPTPCRRERTDPQEGNRRSADVLRRVGKPSALHKARARQNLVWLSQPSQRGPQTFKPSRRVSFPSFPRGSKLGTGNRNHDPPGRGRKDQVLEAEADAMRASAPPCREPCQAARIRAEERGDPSARTVPPADNTLTPI
jgi:hypothetical protein